MLCKVLEYGLRELAMVGGCGLAACYVAVAIGVRGFGPYPLDLKSHKVDVGSLGGQHFLVKSPIVGRCITR